MTLPSSLRSPPATAAILLAVALAIRAWQFGNPVVHIDEQFYLLVGDRLWQGRGLPFVDFWDRKPFGLFLVYAATRMFGGDAVVAYQLAATLCATATAWVVQRLACRIADDWGPLFAGIAYLVYLSVNGGDGGQSPIFYNLPVALAAWAVVRVYERPAFDRTAAGFSALAMVLFGVALQIKYSVLFEGVYFGVALLVAARRLPVLRIVGWAFLWCVLALLPTAAVFALYWHVGEVDALIFANFQSVFLRKAPESALMAERLAMIALHLLPLLIVAGLGVTGVARLRPAGRLLIGWAGAAIAGLLLFGTYFDHYALPLVVPLAVLAAPVLGRPIRALRRSVPVAVPVLAVGLCYVLVNTIVLRGTRGDGRGAYRLAATIGRAPDGCLFVFQGDPILYQLTDACVPTAYNFTTFLSEMGDSRTLGIDPHAELVRVMAARPAYVVISSVDPEATDIEARSFVMRQLARHFRLVDQFALSERVDQLYRRVD